jgi:DNA polymerase-3 subunit alpha
MGIRILPPHVNHSSLKFTPEMCDGTECIRYGLAAIKNVGEAAMEAAIEERDANGEFKSLEDFCARLDSRKINKKVLESLVKCGAFDWTGNKRAPLFAEIDAALAASAASQRDRASGQVSLFGDDAPVAGPKRNGSSSAVAPWPKAEMLAYEKELLGFYVTGHPLDEYRAELESGKYRPIVSLAEMDDKATVHVAGSLVSVEKKFTKKDGKPFAVTVLEDLTGNVEMLAWSETYLKFAQLFELGRVVAVEARLDKREETPRLVASEIKLLKSSGRNGNGTGNGDYGTTPVIVRLSHSQTTEDDLLALRKTIEEFPGPRPLMIEFVNGGGKTVRMKPGPEFNVELSPELQSRLSAWIVSH